jgi:hypothetical protein
VLIKVKRAYDLFKQMIQFYGIIQLVNFIEQNKIKTFDALMKTIPSKLNRSKWLNAGGQLFDMNQINIIRKKLRDGEVNSWEELHAFYTEQGYQYAQQKAMHGLAALGEIENKNLNEICMEDFNNWMNKSIETKEWTMNEIYNSRAKDYSNPYRKMIYDNGIEMDKVLGGLEENSFIKHQQEELIFFKKKIGELKKSFT